MASGATLLVSSICQFAAFVILARTLGVREFADLVLVTAVTSVSVALCGIGAGDAAIRRLARNPSRYPIVMGHGLLLIALSGVVLTVVSSIVIGRLLGTMNSRNQQAATIVLLVVANVPFAAFTALCERVFIGFQEYLKANLLNCGQAVIRLAMTVIACLVLGVSDLRQWAYWLFGTQLVIALLSATTLRDRGPVVLKISAEDLRLGAHNSLPIVCDSLRENLDRILLAAVVEARSLAVYGAAMRIAITSQVAIISLSRVVYPVLAKNVFDNRTWTRHIALLYLGAVLSVSFLTAVAVYLLAPAIFALFGHQYEGFIGYLRVVCWLVIPIAAQAVPYDILGAQDLHAKRARVYIAYSVLGTAFTIACIPVWGITGAFVAAYAFHIVVAFGLWSLLIATTRQPAPSEGAAH